MPAEDEVRHTGAPPHELHAQSHRSVIRIVLVYALVAALWILFSDTLVEALVRDPSHIIQLSMLKGWLFVAVTSLLLYLLVRRFAIRLQNRQRSHELLATLAHHSDEAIFAKDRAGLYLLFNPMAARIVGKAVDDVLGRDDRAIFPPAQAEMLMDSDRRVMATGEIETDEEQLETAQGARVFLTTRGPLCDQHGQVLGTFGIARDITERKQAEDALRESEANLREAHQLAGLGHWKWNLCSGQHLWSDEVYRIYGRDPGLPPAAYPEVQQYFTPDSWASLATEVERSVAEGVPYACDAEVVRPDGSRRWVVARGRALRDEAGEVVALQGTLQDITERKRAEQEIHRFSTELEQRVHLRTAELEAANQELESFTYAVSHDLRAPLRAMNGFAQALTEDYGEQLHGEAADYLQQIEIASRRMSDLIDGLLSLSRSSRGGLQHDQVDLSAISQQLLDRMTGSEPGRNADIQVQPGLTVRGDRRMLEAVLENLLGNAWKYSARTEHTRIRVYGEAEGDCQWICVADNGAGFDMQHAGMLFTPFQRLHRQDEFPGIGIGLATVQRIVRRHGGSIEASGEPGKGALFRFSLPRTDTVQAMEDS